MGGVYSLDDWGRVTFALSNTVPVQTEALLSEITEISYTNLSTRVAGTPTTATQASGTYTLLLPDLVLTSSSGSTGPFRYVVLYNDTPSSPLNPLIGWYDYGSSITLLDTETLTINYTTSTLTIV